MIGRILTWLVVIGALFWAWKTGVLEAIRSGCVPEIGHEAVLDGPIKGRPIPVAPEKDILLRELDTHIANSDAEKKQKFESLLPLFESGELAMVKPQTKVKILENSSVNVQLVPIKITKAKLMAGEFKGSDVWIERANIVDNPLQQVIQAIRQKEKDSSEP